MVYYIIVCTIRVRTLQPMDMITQSQDLQFQAMLLNRLTQVKILQSQQVHHCPDHCVQLFTTNKLYNGEIGAKNRFNMRLLRCLLKP